MIGGGPGSDTATYSTRTSAVKASIDGVTNDGVSGELDNIQTDVENIIGGSAADTLAGSAGDNALNGNGGSDTVSYVDATAGVTVNLASTTAQITVGAGADTLTNNESVTGSGFDDALTGSITANSLNGGNGNDTLDGADGNDTLTGADGDDALTGGSGTDTASYAAATTAVTIDLATVAAQSTGGAGSDTLVTIESAIGSGFDDSLTGTSGNNVLTGGAGDDVLDGRTGVDTVSYSSASAGVTVNLATTSAQNTVGAGSDTLTGDENITGSAFSDTLTGSAAANSINGQAGADVIDGAAGNDVLTGGTGADNVIGAAGNDTLSIRDKTADIADCGTETDTVTADIADALAGCENANLPQPAQITAGPTDGATIASVSATYSFIALAPATFECSVDTETFTICTSPYQTPPLADGSHTFSVRAVDAVGNVDQTPVSRTFIVDTMPPDTTITGGPTSGATVNTQTPSISFSSEAGATFDCSIDGSIYASCTSPYTTTTLGEGSHTFSVQAKDAVGNTDVTPASRSFEIDVTPPETTIAGGPAHVSHINFTSSTFTFLTEAGAVFECEFDTTGYSPCSSPFATGDLAEGLHEFRVRAVDAVGNVDASPEWREFTVDTTPPTVTILDPLSGSVFNWTGLSVAFLISDGSTTCQIDGGTSTACSSPVMLSDLTEGAHALVVTSTDLADNSGSAVADFSIDHTPPETSITGGPAHLSTTNAVSPVFVFDASEPGSAFRCREDGGIYAPCGSSFTSPVLSDGVHTIDVYAVDAAGNIDQSPESRTFYVDTLLPEISIQSPASDQLFNTQTVNAMFTVSDASSLNVECQVDALPVEPCSAPYAMTGLTDGSHTLQVFAIDVVGNSNTASVAFSTDVTPPDVSITGGPADGATITELTPTFEFVSNDQTATFACSVDSGAFNPCVSPFTTDTLANGAHTFSVRPVDSAILVDLPARTRYFNVASLIVPDTFIDAIPSVTAALDSRLEFHSNLEGATFECSIGEVGAAPQWDPCVNPSFMSIIGDDGVYEFQVRASLDGQIDPTPATRLTAIDLTPPTVEISGGPSGVVAIGDVTFEFLSSDGASGFYCSMDGAVYEACGSPITFSGLGDGRHTFNVIGFDGADNESAPSERVFEIDAPPETSIIGGPDEGSAVGSGSVAFELESELRASFYCSIDGAEYSDCASPFSLDGLSHGSHVFRVRALDDDGNLEQTPAERRFDVDLEGPDVAVESSPDGVTNEKTPVIEFSSSEADSVFRCSYNGEAYFDCESPLTLPELPEGDFQFVVYALDRFENPSETLVRSFTVQNVYPTTGISSGPADGAFVSTASVQFEFFSDDPDATFMCSVDGAASEACAPALSIGELADGIHSFSVYAVDLDSTPDPTPEGIQFTVDSGPPTVSVDVSATSPTPDRTPEFVLLADEPVMAFECSVDNGGFLPCSNPYRPAPLSDGSHQLAVQASDFAGNVSETVIAFVVVDGSAETTITSGPVDGQVVGTAEVSFSFEANEPATFECSVDSAAFGSCASPFDITSLSDGPHVFAVRSIDAGAIVEQPGVEARFSIDTIPPVATVTNGPESPTNNTWPEFTFEADEESTFLCRADVRAYRPCVSPLNLGFVAVLSEGAHEFSVKAVDVAGNESEPALWSFVVDLTPPTTTIETALPDNVWLPADSRSMSIVQQLIGDPNGDGRDDAVMVSDTGNWLVAASDGSKFVLPPDGEAWASDFGSDASDRFLADVNGDGKDDAVIFYSVGDWYVRYSNGLAFGEMQSLTTPFGDSTKPQEFPVNAFMGDINADGCEDAIAVYSGLPVAVEYWAMDFSWVSGEPTGCASGRSAPSRGPASNPLPWEVGAPIVEYSGAVNGWFEHHLIDVNEYDDLPALAATDGSQWRIYDVTRRLYGLTDEYATYSEPEIGAERRMLGDVTGDGRDDLVNWNWLDGEWSVAPLVKRGAVKRRWLDTDVSIYQPRYEFRVEDNKDPAWARGFDIFDQHSVANLPDALLGDVNGDGRADAVLADGTRMEWKVLLSTGRNFINGEDSATDTAITASSEPGASFECAIDWAQFFPCDGTLSASGELSDGPHSLAIRAVDEAGNADREPHSYPVVIDTKAPEVQIDLPEDMSTVNDPTPTVTIRSEPGVSFECRFDDEPFEPCVPTGMDSAGPFFWSRYEYESSISLSDGRHRFEVRARDRVGHESSVVGRSFRIDDTPPEINMVENPPVSTPVPPSEAVFRFSSEPGATYECYLDGVARRGCGSPWRFEHHRYPEEQLDGAHSFSVKATDVAGNVSSTTTLSFVIDGTPPAADVDPPETEFVYPTPDDGATVSSSRLRFWFRSDEPIGTFECTVDAGSPFSCTSPYVLTGVEDGAHTFTVRAADGSGNVDQTAASRVVIVGAVTEPDTTITQAPASPTADRSPTFEFAGGGENGTHDCRLDAGEWRRCASPYTIPSGFPLTDGTHTFVVRSVEQDAVDRSPASVVFDLDTSAPELAIITAPEEGSTTTVTQQTVTFESSDPSASFECGVDGGLFVPCTSPWTTPNLDDGLRSIAVRAVDDAGNDSSYVSRGFTVDLGGTAVQDATAPSVEIQSGPAMSDVVSSGDVEFSFSVSEAALSECSLDGAQFLLCESPIAFSDLPDGLHDFRVQATDDVGNVGSALTAEFTVDSAAPQAPEILGGNQSNTGYASVSFEGEPDAVFECSLDHSQWTSCDSPLGLGPLSDGWHSFDVRQIDSFSRISPSQESGVTVDKVAPPPPRDLSVIADTGEIVTIAWESQEDENEDGQSDVAGVEGYSVRSRLRSSGVLDWSQWSDWTNLSRFDNRFTRADIPYGYEVEFEVVQFDAVKNVSSPATVATTMSVLDRPVILSAVLGGDLYHDLYAGPNSSLSAEIWAWDEGDCVSRVSVGQVTQQAGGFSELSSTDVECDEGHPVLCPASCRGGSVGTVTFDTAAVPEGEVHFAAVAYDTRGTISEAATNWSVLVDKTPPNLTGAASVKWQQYFGSDDGRAQIPLDFFGDPDIDEAHRGSGLSAADVRYRVDSGDFAEWNHFSSSDGNELVFPEPLDVENVRPGQVIEIEVRTQDAVGNESEPMTSAVVVPNASPQRASDEAPILPDGRSALHVTVFNDENGNGVFDTWEQYADGVSVSIDGTNVGETSQYSPIDVTVADGLHSVAVSDTPVGSAVTTRSAPVSVSEGGANVALVGVDVPEQINPAKYAPVLVMPFDATQLKEKKMYWPVNFDILEEMKADEDGNPVDSAGGVCTNPYNIFTQPGICSHVTYTQMVRKPGQRGVPVDSRWANYSSRVLGPGDGVIQDVNPPLVSGTVSKAIYDTKINNPFDGRNITEQQRAFLHYVNQQAEPQLQPISPNPSRYEYRDEIDASSRVYWFPINNFRPGKWAIEYWFFYTYNNFDGNDAGADLHEGDWEQVIVSFPDGSAKPDAIFFGQHGKNIERAWNSPEVHFFRGSNHPLAYVARGSQATYPQCGSKDLIGPFEDRTAACITDWSKGFDHRRMYICPDGEPGLDCSIESRELLDASYESPTYWIGPEEVPRGRMCWRGSWGPNENSVREWLPGVSPVSPMRQHAAVPMDREDPAVDPCLEIN